MTWIPLLEPTKEETSWLLREFKRKARFLVDENLGFGTTELLRAANWNVKDVSEVELKGRPDESVLAYAYRNDRVLLTHDDDFLDNRKFPLKQNAGIIVLPGASGPENTLVRALGGMLSIIGQFHKLYRQTKIRIAEDGTMTFTHYGETGGIETVRYKFPKHGMPLIWREG